MTRADRVQRVIDTWRAQGGQAAALAGQRRFVCWKRMPKRDGQGFTKPPIDPNTGRNCDVHNKANLLSADDALRHLNAGRCDGIGIVTGDFDGLPLCGIDIDHCIHEDGSYSTERSEDMVQVALAGYCELSPSKTGIHGLALCRKPAGMSSRSGSIEIYDDGQYLTLTGIQAEGMDAPLSDSNAAVEFLCKKYLTPRKPAAQKPAAEAAICIPGERLRIAFEKDSVFAALWNGNRPNGNESADDMALMNKLAYWLDQGEEGMISAFRASPHAASKDEEHRKKMNRQDYLHRTAAKAVQDCKRTASEDDAAYQKRIHPTAEEVFSAPAPAKAKRIPPVSCISASALASKHFDTLRQPVEGLICEGLTMVVGASKIGKSWFILDLCLSVALGQTFLSRKTTPGTVLYYALEDSQRRLQSRIKKIGLPVSENMFMATDAASMGKGFEEQIDEWMADHPDTTLIVVDTLQKIRGVTSRGVNAYQADYQDLGGLKAIAEKYRIALVMVHHTNKLRNVEDSFDKISGSAAIMGASDTALLINRERGSKEATVRFEGRDVWGDDFIMRMDDHCRWNVTFSDADEHFEAEAYTRKPIVQMLRKLMADNPQGVRIGYEKFKADCLELLGEYPFIDGRECSKLISEGLGDELRRRDNIIVECGIKVSGGNNGMKVRITKPLTEFQMKLA